MKKKLSMYFIPVLGFLILFLGNVAAAGPVAVIVNADNPVNALSNSEIKNYYENNIVTWPGGNKIKLYDLKLKEESRQKFSIVILGRAANQVAMEWSNKKITNTAKNPPKTVSSDVLMQNKVANDPWAIGYLSEDKVTSKKVKIVGTIE